MSNIKPCVIIPTHKSEFTENELKSIHNTCSILEKYDIYIIFPRKIRTEIVQKLSNLNILFAEYPNQYFNSMASYNIFLTMGCLYKDFESKGYSHMLIAHVDSYVFKDDLGKWCSTKLSYIGAPWFESGHNHDEIKFIGSGNGGFSLRKISAFLNVIEKINQVQKHDHFLVGLYLRFMKIFSKNFIIFRYFIRPVLIGNIHEDTFWGMLAPNIDTEFVVANEKQSISFAFETYPEVLFEKNAQQLPFGCHSWENYNPEFWKKFIN